MKYYSVKFALNVADLGEMSLANPYVYEAESIPQLVTELAPICEDSNLVIVSIQPATEDEVYEYLRGDVEEDEADPEWDEYDDGYDEFWQELIESIEGL